MRYVGSSVQAFCEHLCWNTETEESTRREAAAALAELRNRADAKMLLRAGMREEDGSKKELLRAASGGISLTPDAKQQTLRHANKDIFSTLTVC